jgi:hypothetical protein
MPSAAASILADLAPLFEELGLRWYLFGAQAAIHYGSPRATADVDVTVELRDLAPSVLVGRLEEIGITARIELDDDFIAQSRVLPMLHEKTGMGVDVVLAGPGPEETFLDRARRTPFGDVEVPMASPTDMVVMKILAGRPKDVDDVIGILLAAPEGLDVAEARGLLGELGEMLDQSDLVATLDVAVERAGRR